jgi:spore maturation protein CgeB
LAARTSEAPDWFRPEVEASFFDDIADCAHRIRYWLAHEAERRAVAEAGYIRAQKQMNIDQSMAPILAHLEGLKGECGIG